MFGLSEFINFILIVGIVRTEVKQNTNWIYYTTYISCFIGIFTKIIIPILITINVIYCKLNINFNNQQNSKLLILLNIIQIILYIVFLGINAWWLSNLYTQIDKLPQTVNQQQQKKRN